MSSETDEQPPTRRPLEPLVGPTGLPSLAQGDVVLVSFGNDRRQFMVTGQMAGTGIAVRMIVGDGRLCDDPWILTAEHFRTPWVLLGKYEPPVPVVRSWWHLF